MNGRILPSWPQRRIQWTTVGTGAILMMLHSARNDGFSKMKTIFRILSLGALVAFVSGCESTSFTDRLESVPPQVQLVDGPVERVYVAAQKAFKRLDFVLVRAAINRIEAASAIRTSETFGDSRQTVARVRLAQVEPGRTEVQLRLTQETSSSAMGGTRQENLREHSFYQTYFATLQQVMQEQAADEAGSKD